MERDDSACRYGDFLTGSRIATGAFPFVAEVEVPESRQFDRFVALERGGDLLEEALDDFLGFALVEAQILEQPVRHLRLGHCTQRRVPRCGSKVPRPNNTSWLTVLRPVVRF